ncbi:P-loop ATPase, Sll1717 family [Neorhizobium sp. T25_13]|uniref:P-loop ATPase, Sll1717 family n=1 Tax=Neorhizobium sp. T25_13 TaxID=2093830 RepID=UPI000CF8A04E|nr:DNA repair ATPase [Neorhizobium sp. T25_13]
MAARNNHIITRDIRVGKNAAEEDTELLFDCFVDSRALNEAMDPNSNASIISGRTGSGKSAIIQYLHRREKTAYLSPIDMAMTHISNSDVMRFLNDIGADLNLFFQAIWKHVLLVEYIRLKYRIEDETNSRKWVNSIFERFSTDKGKSKAVAYLEKYSGSLWVTIDENVRQLTESYEGQIRAELGVDVSKFASKAGYGVNLSQQTKSEYIARVRKIMNSEQLQDLSKVISLLAEGSASSMDIRYILIDHLDERWVDEGIKYRLINALVEALPKFRPIRNLKIIVALRTDVIERSIQENEDSAFQREKFRDKLIGIEWNHKMLKELIDKRIGLSFRRKYSPQRQVLFDDLFASKVRGQTAFDYIIDRTLLRPRDLISFTNECLDVADHKSEIAPSDVYTAELKYSQYRYEALLDEWRVPFPNLSSITELLRRKRSTFKISELDDHVVDNAALEISASRKASVDPLTKAAAVLCDSPSPHSRLSFIKIAVSTMYRVGAIGLKLSPSEPTIYSHRDRPIVDANEITEDTGVRVVKMLYAHLRIDDGGRK